MIEPSDELEDVVDNIDSHDDIDSGKLDGHGNYGENSIEYKDDTISIWKQMIKDIEN
ncbi:hypothetical protein KI387_033467, partial [Taxus chinensis]